MRRFDTIDKKLLKYLQQDARISNAELARRVGMVPSGVFERLKKLQASGVIQGFETRINPQSLGLGLLAFVFVRAEDPSGSLKAATWLAKIPEAEEVHHVAGEDCYLLKVRARDPQELGRILRQKIGTVKGVRSTRTTIVLATHKESRRLEIPKAFLSK